MTFTERKMNPSYQYSAKVIRVVDGDTFDAEIDLGFFTFTRIRFRLARVNAAETNAKDVTEKMNAAIATDFLKVRAEGHYVTIVSRKTEKFGRWLAELFVGGENINDLMLQKGLVREYK